MKPIIKDKMFFIVIFKHGVRFKTIEKPLPPDDNRTKSDRNISSNMIRTELWLYDKLKKGEL